MAEKKKTAFAIAAHPDDVEFMMAGTLLLLQKAGYEIHYMNVANGALGSMTLDRVQCAAERRAESLASCAAARAVYHESIAEDVSLFYDAPTLAKLVAIVREVSPEIILTHGPYDYMEDHVNAGRLAVGAAFCRGMPNFRCNTPITLQDVAVYHSMPHSVTDSIGRKVVPDFYVDVSSVMSKKEEMLSCHLSQKEWLDKTQGGGSYVNSMRSRMKIIGGMSGKVECAEGWIRHNSIGFSDEGFDPISVALKSFVS